MSRFGQDPIPGMPQAERPQPPAPTRAELPAAAPVPGPVPDPSAGPISERIGGFRVLNGPWSGDLVEIPGVDDDLTIGRNDPPSVVVDIDLSDAELGKPPMISRRHATIRRAPDGSLTIRDVGSTNGTWVDGARLRPGDPAQTIRTGDLLRLANIEMVAEAEGART